MSDACGVGGRAVGARAAVAHTVGVQAGRGGQAGHAGGGLSVGPCETGRPGSTSSPNRAANSFDSLAGPAKHGWAASDWRGLSNTTYTTASAHSSTPT